MRVEKCEKVRNAALHGDLISPYSSEEVDAPLLALAALRHALTREIVRPTVSLV